MNPDTAHSQHKKIYIKTYGCQMNFYDSGRMEDLMAPLGYHLAESPDGADMVVLNTCHIREKAAEKLYSDLGRLRPFKQRKEENGERMVIAVAGCVAQAEGDEIRRRAPYVDIVVGPQTFQKLPEMVAKSLREHAPAMALEFGVEEKFDALPQSTLSRGTQAFVTIQEGCDKFCSFCVVPYTRGAEYSRPVGQVEAEVRRLVEGGVREITLLGQNVNAYHGEQGGESWSLGRLIRHLAAIGTLERIRYTTSHPRDMDQELIEAHGDVEKLMPFLHLPVQSGSDRILKMMNRKHTAKHYLELIDKFRKVRPDMAFSSDFIVGFPGESELDFEASLQLIREVGYAQAYSFKYSIRPGTPAAVREDQVPEEVKTERLARLQELLDQQQRAFNQACVGTRQRILIERPGKQPGQMSGRSPYMQLVHLDQCDLPAGSFAEAVIAETFSHSMRGTLITQQPMSRSA